MRPPAFVFVGSVLWTMLWLTQPAAAQAVASPTIHRVTLQPDAGVITISGTGLGPDLFVSVDGHPVPQVPGATDTQIQVLAPATILTTPGSYRLTVVDPARQLGDAFVVATSEASVVPPRGLAPSASGGGVSVEGAHEAAPATRGASAPKPNGVGQNLVESATITAVGLNALASNTGTQNTAIGVNSLRDNTTGWDNTASGAFALNRTTTGSSNTATGSQAMLFNTTGAFNTASGYIALFYNTTGAQNTASGAEALYSNTTGFYNTANGSRALKVNSTGAYNTASGAEALYSNSTGHDNTADGYQALYSNSTGFYNVASGYRALNLNTTGHRNTASGAAALYANTTGFQNTASGEGALYANTTGHYNTANGAEALFANTTGTNNTALGVNAGYNVTTGSYNVYLGAEVVGTAADTNTIRIGLPYDGGTGVGQNQTFLAGVWGNPVTGTAAQVFVDANGKLGTGTPVAILSGMATLMTPAAVQQQLQEQQATNAEQQATIADLRARLARLEALVKAAARRR